jgi:hypothetical protein
MKKGLKAYLVAGLVGIFANANVYAQDTTTPGEDIKDAAKKTGQAVKKTAKKVGDKSAEIASKSKSAVVDKKYEGKQGPNGQTIYINNKSEYYWVDKKGRRHYISAAQLKDKDS